MVLIEVGGGLRGIVDGAMCSSLNLSSSSSSSSNSSSSRYSIEGDSTIFEGPTGGSSLTGECSSRSGDGDRLIGDSPVPESGNGSLVGVAKLMREGDSTAGTGL